MLTFSMKQSPEEQLSSLGDNGRHGKSGDPVLGLPLHLVPPGNKIISLFNYHNANGSKLQRGSEYRTSKYLYSSHYWTFLQPVTAVCQHMPIVL